MDLRLSGASRGLPQHGVHRAAGVCVPARHAVAHATAAATLLGAVDAPIGDPWGLPQGLFSCTILAAPPGRGVRHDCMRLCECSVCGWWVRCSCASHRQRTAGRRLAVGAPSINSRSVNNVGWCGVESRTAAPGAMWGIRRQWQRQPRCQGPRGCGRHPSSHHCSHGPSAPACRW